MNVFVEDDYTITSRLKTNVGLHFSRFSVENKFYTSIEPRFSMRYLATDKITLKAAYSKMQQYLHLLSNTTIGLPTDLWLPVTKQIKPQVSNQYAVGAVYTPVSGYDLSLESFYKQLHNLIEYKDGASFFGSSTGWEDKVEMGDGRSYGLEAMIRKESGNTTGWIGYTLSKTERYFEQLNSGQWYPAKYDRRHDISVVLTHNVNDKFDFGATWVFGTGSAFTLSTHNIQILGDENSQYNENNESLPYFEERNNYRMPSYHRLDFGRNFHKKKKRYPHLEFERLQCLQSKKCIFSLSGL